jgi:hypothetical protein
VDEIYVLWFFMLMSFHARQRALRRKWMPRRQPETRVRVRVCSYIQVTLLLYVLSMSSSLLHFRVIRWVGNPEISLDRSIHVRTAIMAECSLSMNIHALAALMLYSHRTPTQTHLPIRSIEQAWMVVSQWHGWHQCAVKMDALVDGGNVGCSLCLA